jgi:Ni/Fe-hydrogenase subunit HybB-like protein
MIFTRPQWQSWLVKGAFIIAGYTLLLALHFIASLAGSTEAQSILIPIGLTLATLTAVYTAYLFAQAKARDMWQNPLLPPHLFVQALLVGSAALAPIAAWLDASVLPALFWTLGATSVLHLLMVCGETTLAHPTTHARLAVWEMTTGRYRAIFLVSIVLSLMGIFAPWLELASVSFALVGLLLYEHAYVQAGQSVPLA